MKTYHNFLQGSFVATVVLLLMQPILCAAYQAAPVAITSNPTYVTEKSVSMNGQVNANETPDTYAWFEWGISGRNTVYETDHRQMWGGSTLSNFSATVNGLAPNVQYFYRQIAESSRGRDVGITTYFTTKTIVEPIDPIVIIETRSPESVLEKSAMLRGYIAPHEGKRVEWWFEYGTTNKFENITQTSKWGADSGIAQVNVTNLTPGTVYFYRIAAENSLGIVRGAAQSLTTKGIAPSPSEVAKAQAIPSPSAGGGSVSGSGVAANGVIPGSAYYPAAALNFPTFNFNTLFGGKKATNNTASVANADGVGSTGAQAAGVVSNSKTGTNGSSANQNTIAGSPTPLGTFWNTLTGKKIAEVNIEKIGPSKAPAHTAVEYRVTYAYRRTDPATSAKLKVILPGTVVYIGDNTTNELLLEEGSGPERTYVLPVGRLESGSTRTISILGMTTSDAGGTFPDARARLEYSLATGGVEVVSAEGTAVASAATAKASSSSSTFSIFPTTILGWLLYVAIIALLIFGIRKGRAYYVKRKDEIAISEETDRRAYDAKQLGGGPLTV